MDKAKLWTDEENDFLRANYGSMSNIEIGAALNKSEGSVSSRMARMHLRRWKLRMWRHDQEQFVRDHFVTMTDREMGEALGKTGTAVKYKRRELELRRTADNVETLVRHGEGKAIRTAEEFAAGLEGMNPYDIAQRMGDRIAEVDACISRLYANSPKRRGWSTADNLAAAKLIALRRDLRLVTFTGVDMNNVQELA